MVPIPLLSALAEDLTAPRPTPISRVEVVPEEMVVGAGVVVGVGVVAGVTYGVGRSHKRKLIEVQTELEGVLDTLELGRSLEPPPASWRRWVKRNFHGVARDLMGTDDDPGK